MLGDNRKFTLEEVKDWIRMNTKFTCIDSNYQGSGVPLLCKCNECGHEWAPKYRDIRRGKAGCKICWKTRWTTEKITSWLQEHHRNLQLLEEYKDCHYHHSWLCLKCNTQFQLSWSNVRMAQKESCPTCRKPSNLKWTLDKIHSLLPKNVLLLSDVYSHIHHPMEWKCLDCGLTWNQTWNELKQGHGCPKCKFKNEKQVGRILAEFGVKAFPKDLKCPPTIRDSQRVRLDFLLPDYNAIMEYHGSQHFLFPNFWHKNLETFEKQQARDLWLRTYCKDNRIPLLEIPYNTPDMRGVIIEFLISIHHLPGPVAPTFAF